MEKLTYVLTDSAIWEDLLKIIVFTSSKTYGYWYIKCPKVNVSPFSIN